MEHNLSVTADIETGDVILTVLAEVEGELKELNINLAKEVAIKVAQEILDAVDYLNDEEVAF